MGPQQAAIGLPDLESRLSCLGPEVPVAARQIPAERLFDVKSSEPSSFGQVRAFSTEPVAERWHVPQRELVDDLLGEEPLAQFNEFGQLLV